MDVKKHFKMYKVGKYWVVAGMSVFVFGVALTVSEGVVVHADTTSVSGTTVPKTVTLTNANAINITLTSATDTYNFDSSVQGVNASDGSVVTATITDNTGAVVNTTSGTSYTLKAGTYTATYSDGTATPVIQSITVNAYVAPTPTSNPVGHSMMMAPTVATPTTTVMTQPKNIEYKLPTGLITYNFNSALQGVASSTNGVVNGKTVTAVVKNSSGNVVSATTGTSYDLAAGAYTVTYTDGSSTPVTQTVLVENGLVSVTGTNGPYTMLASDTMIGDPRNFTPYQPNSTADSVQLGLFGRIMPWSEGAPTITGAGTVQTGNYSGSSVTGADGKSYGANWGAASLLTTTDAYVASGLSVGSQVTQTWPYIGTLNGQPIGVAMTFTVDKLQSTTQSSYLTISKDLNTFVSAHNINGHFTLSFYKSDATYTDTGISMPLTYLDTAYAQDTMKQTTAPLTGSSLSLAEVQNMALLGASLTAPSEYLTTNDATDVLLSSNPAYPTDIQPVSINPNALGIGNSAVKTIFTSKSVANMKAANDSDYDNYAYLYGASFLNFKTTTPTFYFGGFTGSNSTTATANIGTNHLMFEIAASPFNVAGSIQGSGAATWVPTDTTVNIKNTVTPTSGAVITNAVVGMVQEQDGTVIPSNEVTATTDGTVVFAGQSNPGVYTIPITYTDNVGNTVTVLDTVSVSTGNIVGTVVNVPVVAHNTPNLSGTITNTQVGVVYDPTAGTFTNIPVLDPNGNNVPITGINNQVTVDPTNPDNLTLAGQVTPGIYKIPVTYTDINNKSVTVYDFISVGQGQKITNTIGKVTTLPANVIDPLPDGTDISNSSLDQGTLGQVMLPDGSVVSPVGVASIDPITGQVSLASQMVPGVYTIPVTYTNTYTDTEGIAQKIASTVDDVVTLLASTTGTGTVEVGNGPITVMPIPVAGTVLTTPVIATGNTSIKGRNTGSTIPLSDISFDNNGNLIFNTTFGDGTPPLLPDTYVIPVTYQSNNGPIQANYTITVTPKPLTEVVHNSTLLVNDPWLPTDNFDSGTDSVGNPIAGLTNVTVTVTPAGSTTPVSTIDTKTAGNYDVTYTYTDPITSLQISKVALVGVVTEPAVTLPTDQTIVTNTPITISPVVTPGSANVTTNTPITTVETPDGTIITVIGTSYTPTTPGTYTVTTTVPYTNPDGSTGTTPPATEVITVVTPPTVTVPADRVVVPNMVVDITPTITPGSANVTTGTPVTTVTTPTGTTTTLTGTSYTPTTPGTYTVTTTVPYTNPDGSTGTTPPATEVITVVTPPTVTVPADRVVVPNMVVDITPTITPGSANVTTGTPVTTVTTPTGTTTTLTGTSYTPTTPGTYTVTTTVPYTNPDGSTGTTPPATEVITVVTPPTVTVPADRVVVPNTVVDITPTITSGSANVTT
ncbi:hypothetical protein ESZ50_04145, partial [Weissella muntiaci]